MVKPVNGPLLDPLLFGNNNDNAVITPKSTLSRRSNTHAHIGGRRLGKHDSVIEQLIAAQPMKPEDVVYPTNMAAVLTPSTISLVGLRTRNERLEDLLEALPAQRLAGLVTVAIFAGYAALFSMQHVIKVYFGIPDDDSKASHDFSFAITSLYLWNLIFRLGHNVILRPFGPRQRSLMGLCAMVVSMLILAVFVFGQGIKSIYLVALAYAFGGIAIGTFETNYSVVLAALGNKTKVIGISGIPVGIFLIIVPGFVAVTAGLAVEYIYWSVVALVVGAIGILMSGLTFPEVDWLLSSNSLDMEVDRLEATGDDLSVQGETNVGTVREKGWVLKVISVGLVFTLNMLFVSAFSPGVLLYLYNTSSISLLPLDWTISTGYFFAIFSSFGFVADVVSRRRIYAKKPRLMHPVRFLVLTAMGVGIILLRLPLIAPLGTLLVFYANGSIYAQSCRWIDLVMVGTENKFLVFANSIFFFLGDCGSVLGALLIPFIRDLMS
jgi:MFS family permease